MEPIINPWFFYWVDVADGVKSMSLVLGVALLFMTAGCYLCYFWMTRDLTDNIHCYTQSWLEQLERDASQFFKAFIILGIIGVIFLILAIIIPSGSVCYKMLVSSMVTSDNIMAAETSLQSVVDYIVEIVEQLMH